MTFLDNNKTSNTNVYAIFLYDALKNGMILR